MRKRGGEGLSGDECEEEAAAVVSGGFTHARPQLSLRNRRLGCEVLSVSETVRNRKKRLI